MVEQAQLAGVFEDYIKHNLTVAAAQNGPPEQAGPPLGSTETPAFATFFPPQTVTGTIRITPLLTPDPGVYVTAVKGLIASATQTLYLQFHYIELPRKTDATSQAFADLIQVLVGRRRRQDHERVRHGRLPGAAATATPESSSTISTPPSTSSRSSSTTGTTWPSRRPAPTEIRV